MSDFDSVCSNTFVGKYVIVRGFYCGCWAGTVEAIRFVDHRGEVVLSQARRLFFWQSAKSITLSGIAKYGISTDEEINKVAPAVERVLLEACEVILATDEARRSIVAAPEAEAVSAEESDAIMKIIRAKQQSNWSKQK